MNVYVLIMQRSKNTESQSVETELQFSDVVKMENFDPDAAITSWWMTFIAPVSEDYTIHWLQVHILIAQPQHSSKKHGLTQNWPE